MRGTAEYREQAAAPHPSGGAQVELQLDDGPHTDAGPLAAALGHPANARGKIDRATRNATADITILAAP
jgi:hypothetical protein